VAIYTELSSAQWAELTKAYALGTLHSVEGVPQGSINSNFKIDTERGRFFVRHTSVRSETDLRFEAGLLALLKEGAFPGPQLERARDGAPFLPLANGRASVFHLLPGDELHRHELSDEHLEQLGREVGKLHRLSSSFTGSRDNPYGFRTVSQWLEELRNQPDPEIQSALEVAIPALLDATQALEGKMLPRGPVHSDIFLDNVKWLGDRISAIFDFEMACVDAYTLDVAITLNAWCFDRDYEPLLCRAFIRGYQEQRPLTEDERQALHAYALFGAARYTASRIRDFHLSPLPPEKLVKKDFRTYVARLRRLQELGPQSFRTLLAL